MKLIVATHIYQTLKIPPDSIAFAYKSNANWKLFKFMTFYFVSKYTEHFASFISFIKSACPMS